MHLVHRAGAFAKFWQLDTESVRRYSLCFMCDKFGENKNIGEV